MMHLSNVIDLSLFLQGHLLIVQRMRTAVDV